MTSVAQVADVLTQIFGAEADRLARETGCIQRQRRFSGSSLAQTLVFAWLHHPETTLEKLASAAASCQVVVTDSAIEKRFTKELADFLHALLHLATAQVVQVTPVEVALFKQFRAVVLEDSSTITLPDALAPVWRGCGGNQSHTASAVKLHVRLDLLRGGIQGPLLTESRVSDNHSPLRWDSVPKGGMLVTDLGYFCLRRFGQMDRAGRFFLSRLKGYVRLYWRDGRPLELDERVLPQGVNEVAEYEVLVDAGERLPVRLIAVRVPAEVAEQRREDLREDARRRGQGISDAQLRLADWTLVITNVPLSMLDRSQVLIVLRARWQIELLFRLWKKVAQIDESRSQNPWRILCELYAKLLAVLVEHWIMLQGCWQDPHRSSEKAFGVVSDRAYLLLSGLRRGKRALARAIAEVVQAMRAGCRLNTRKTHPNASQLWLDGLEWELKWV
jgi:hypothetical protein